MLNANEEDHVGLSQAVGLPDGTHAIEWRVCLCTPRERAMLDRLMPLLDEWIAEESDWPFGPEDGPNYVVTEDDGETD